VDNVNVRFKVLMSAQSFSLSAQRLGVRPKGFGHGLSCPLGPRQGAHPLSVRPRGAYEAQLHFSTQGCVEKAKDGASLGDLCGLPS